MKYLAITLLFLLTGCDTYKAYVISPDYIDSAFLPYTNCYEGNTDTTMPDKFSIIFDERADDIAQCYKNAKGGKKHILVDKDFWRALTELEREFIIFHELGHCLEDLEHDDDSFNYMNTMWPVHETIVENREQLYLDFFGHTDLMCVYE